MKIEIFKTEEAGQTLYGVRRKISFSWFGLFPRVFYKYARLDQFRRGMEILWDHSSEISSWNVRRNFLTADLACLEENIKNYHFVRDQREVEAEEKEKLVKIIDL